MHGDGSISKQVDTAGEVNPTPHIVYAPRSTPQLGLEGMSRRQFFPVGKS